MPLVGHRLLLRPPEPRDAPAIARALADPEVRRWIPLPGDYSVRQAREFVRRAREELRTGAGYSLSVFLRSNGELIGGCALNQLRAAHRGGHIGYWIGRAHWGHRYAPEAASLLIAAGFRRLGLHRVDTGAIPQNRRSIHVLRRLGFRVEGRFRDEYFVDGRYWDSIRFGLLRPEFRPFRP